MPSPRRLKPGLHARKRKIPPRRSGVEVFILAGGLSTRMGRDKSRLRFGRRTMLGQIREIARGLGYPVRTVYRDAVPRCGPLGGIYTGLKRSRGPVVLFLACDMPFVSAEFLGGMIDGFTDSETAIFATDGKRAGFPCLLRKEGSLPVVIEQIGKSALSLQSLAKSLNAKTIQPSPALPYELTNVNSSGEFAAALDQFRTARE